MRCLPIFLDAELNSLFYNGYCKSILSPALHGCSMVYDDAETSFSWQKNTAETLTYQNAYRRVNNVFAPGDSEVLPATARAGGGVCRA